ncbi:hypothetical protein YC2023_115803 [Brassica napus]
MLGFQLDIKKKYELWSLVGPEPLTSFWEMLGVHVEAGPSTQEIIAALERCEGWSRDVLMDSVKGRDISGCYTINGFAQALQVRYLLQSGRLRRKLIIKSSDKVTNFIQKDTGEMFSKWEFDVEDPLAENIIKLMFVKKPWNPAKKKVVKEDSPRPQKKAHKEAPAEASEEAAAEASEEDIVDAMREGFGTCLKEIKYLSERVEAVEKKVGITTKRKGTSSQNTTSPPKPTLEPGVSNKSLDFIYVSESVNGTNAGRKSLAEDKDLKKEDATYLEKKDAALALCRAKSDRTRKLARSQKSPYTANRTARVIISNRKLYPGYNPFAPIDKNKLRELAEWLKSCPYYRTALDKKPRKSRTWWYQILRTSLVWLEDCVSLLLHIDAWINVLRKRYNANPQHFRSERMCFLDHLFAQQWRFNFKDFKDSKPDQNGLGRRLPGGAWNYYAGTIPSFCKSNKVWGTDIDDIYVPVNFADSHWIAIWISIPKRHIVVFDSICSSISPEELDVVMEHFLYMVPYLLGIEFSKKDFTTANGKSMRDKMAVDIFQELLDAHEFENKDMDDILGTYDGLNTGRLTGRPSGRLN